MLPSQSQPPPTKRKPDDTGNPLLDAVAKKKAKKEQAKAAASNKRKFVSEEPSGGLAIVRESHTPPPFSQPIINTVQADPAPTRFSSQPLPSSSKPPSKKLKASDSSRPGSSSQTNPAPFPRSRSALPPTIEETQLDDDVRAMEDESDKLRRQSRLNSINAAFRAPSSAFTPQPTVKQTKSGKVTDLVVPLPQSETPQLERNKKLREGAMAAIVNGDESPAATPSRRRGSVGGRGKRISNSFENTGVISQPHQSVSESSFYKHIDCDLTESERMRQLLVWCAMRTSTALLANVNGSTSKTASSSNAPAPDPTLPPLSNKGTQVLKSIQDDIVRMLAEKKINTAISLSSSNTPAEELQENEQNTKNKHWQVVYSTQIEEAKSEEAAWNKVSYAYEAYTKKLQSSIDKRTALAKADPRTLSAKAKGKRRATGEMTDLEGCFPQDNELVAESQRSLALARTTLGHSDPDGRARDNPDPGQTSSTPFAYMSPAERSIRARLPSLEHKLDKLHTYLNFCRSTTNLCERLLNQRFDILSGKLSSRVDPRPPEALAAAAAEDESDVGGFVRMYMTQPSSAVPSSTSGPADSTAPTNPVDLLRALTRVDAARPLTHQSDAVRQAAREVQRAGESGVAPVGDRRVTGVPPPMTPRRGGNAAGGLMPGTPGNARRGTTPNRDR